MDEEIGAPDEIRGRADPEARGDRGELLAERAEEAAEIQHGTLELAWLEPLHTAIGGLGDRLELGRDADVACVELATAADRATDGDHREGSEAHAVGAEAQHLRDVEGALHPAVAPDLDDGAKARRDECAMRLGDADLAREDGGSQAPNLDGKSGAAERVLARRAGAAVVSRERHDVGARLRDPDRDDADVRHDRDLHGHAGTRVHGLQLVDHLREVLDRVDVVVVRRRDEIDSRDGVARERDLLRDFPGRQVAALPGLRALADLDLEVVRRIREERRHTEAAGGDLLSAIAWIPTDEIGELTALAVDAEQIEPRHRLGIRTVRGLALGSERHRRDVEGRRVFARRGIGGSLVRDGAREVEKMAQ